MSAVAGSPVDHVIRDVLVLGQGEPVDIHVRDGDIVAVVPSERTSGRTRVALPGFVDLHTHLREPGGEATETIETGTRAAAAGGYTDVFAMANTSPVTDSVQAVERTRRAAEGVSARVHPNSAATIGLAGERLVDIDALAAAGVRIFSDDGHCVTDDRMVMDLLTATRRLGVVFAQHAQSTSIVGAGVVNDRVAEQVGCAGWPEAGEEAIVARDIAVARATGGRLHVCHVSTRRTVDLVRWAKSVGAAVTAEVTPHHLVLTDDDAVAAGPALKVNPPLRSAVDVTALREALADGTIDVVATDHAPHAAEAKSRPWPEAAFGLTALETALAIVAEVLTDEDGAVDWMRLAEVMSTRPAAIGGIGDIAGLPIVPGGRASLCVVEEDDWIVDPERRFSRSGNTPFPRRPMRHRVVLTMLEGVVTHGAPA